MAHVNKVIRSVEDPNGIYCVDLFRRPDGSFGFVECRRDPEDGRGWAVVGSTSDARFASAEAAWAAAVQQVAWLG